MIPKYKKSRPRCPSFFGRWGCAMLTVMVLPNMTVAQSVEGRLDFVVSSIRYALTNGSGEAAACPNGVSRHTQGSANMCMTPQRGGIDTHMNVVTGNIKVEGINLDNRASDEDFEGFNEVQGVDNQFYRVVGCTPAYRQGGQGNGFETEMRTGAWGLLISVKGVDDMDNDDHVRVGIYANSDPIYLSAKRDPLPYATYAIHQDTQLHAETDGVIRNGKLSTRPIDFKFLSTVNSMLVHRVLRDARLEASINKDGTISGYLAGYSPVEAVYDENFGFRNAITKDGSLAPERLRSRSAYGKSLVLGYNCEGMYQALWNQADGHPDDFGRFTSISQQYVVKGIPAFIVNVPTASLNEELTRSGELK